MSDVEHAVCDEGETGHCLGCSEEAVADAYGAHTATGSEHHPSCQGDCRLCPIPVPIHCGPVVRPPEEGA